MINWFILSGLVQKQENRIYGEQMNNNFDTDHSGRWVDVDVQGQDFELFLLWMTCEFKHCWQNIVIAFAETCR